MLRLALIFSNRQRKIARHSRRLTGALANHNLDPSFSGPAGDFRLLVQAAGRSFAFSAGLLVSAQRSVLAGSK